MLQSFKDDILRGKGLITQGKNYNPYYGDFDSLENKIIDTYTSNKTIATQKKVTKFLKQNFFLMKTKKE